MQLYKNSILIYCRRENCGEIFLKTYFQLWKNKIKKICENFFFQLLNKKFDTDIFTAFIAFYSISELRDFKSVKEERWL